MGAEVLKMYFATIFTSSNPSGFEEILEGVHQSEVEVGEMDMGGEFQPLEVYQALKKMAPLTTLVLMICLLSSINPFVTLWVRKLLLFSSRH